MRGSPNWMTLRRKRARTKWCGARVCPNSQSISLNHNIYTSRLLFPWVCLCTGLSFNLLLSNMWSINSNKLENRTKQKHKLYNMMSRVCCCYAKNSRKLYIFLWMVQCERIRSYWLTLLTPIRESTLWNGRCVWCFKWN